VTSQLPYRIVLFLLCAGLCAIAPLRSLAAPTQASIAQTDTGFVESLDLSPLQRASVQHSSSLKTLDTFSRQVINSIHGRSTIDGQGSLTTLLDMTYRPEEWLDREIIKIRHLPLRQDIADALDIEGDEPRRLFLKNANISLRTYHQPEVQSLLQRLESSDMRKLDAINELRQAAGTVEAMLMGELFPPARVVPPPAGSAEAPLWHTIDNLMLHRAGVTPNEPLPDYPHADADNAVRAAIELREAWIAQDAPRATAAAADLAEALEAISPAAYPSSTKRNAEVIYNRLAKLTLPAAAVYFVAFALFLVSAYSGTPRLRLWGLRFMLLAVLVHTAGIAIRWWLVEKSTGDWFHSIPIKNQFESVMFSAWFGAVVGLLLEMKRKKPGGGLFGAAASFVGWLALVALFASPYVFGRDIGGEIRHVNGILMSYWLYIHVTMVTASYALIGMSFLLAIWWLVVYRSGRGNTVRENTSPTAPGGFWRTLGRVFFLPVAERPAQDAGAFAMDVRAERPQTLLQRLDAANLVILQLAFWILGAGVIFGAVWADMSWGRPWGWDPKETFALVTWIVYLIIIHVRLVTRDKALWTAVLAVIGFFVMLFNWIGVNFFLVGLHSYA
jgi:cytochrome c-type biogenesis protein CcsB